MKTIRVLTVTDLHQSRLLSEQLLTAVKTHEPAIIAFVGDFLNALDPAASKEQFGAEEFAEYLAKFPGKCVFIRGNHEEQNWTNFVYAWPHEKAPLIALHGTAFQAGPLVLVGFPCALGWQEPWCESMPKAGNELSLDPVKSGIKRIPADSDKWLPKVMRELGPSGRHLWLVHEPPLQHAIAGPMTWNPQWKKAVERFSPLVVVSGHDHEAPIKNAKWNTKIGDSLCVNVGQKNTELQYCVLDFDFCDESARFPSKIKVSAHPWKADKFIHCG
jgi:Icc-related predicted phosphoesterase